MLCCVRLFGGSVWIVVLSVKLFCMGGGAFFCELALYGLAFFCELAVYGLALPCELAL